MLAVDVRSYTQTIYHRLWFLDDESMLYYLVARGFQTTTSSSNRSDNHNNKHGKFIRQISS
jgi:hypothetical protein